MTLQVEGFGSHLSSQIWVKRPFQTLYLVPLCRTSRLLKILLHVKEGLLPRFAWRISQKGKYLALRVRAAKELGFKRILQACFASKARLKACKFLKPILPCDLGLHTVFQPTQAILVSWFFCPHQKLLISSQGLHRESLGVKSNTLCQWERLGSQL